MSTTTKKRRRYSKAQRLAIRKKQLLHFCKDEMDKVYRDGYKNGADYKELQLKNEIQFKNQQKLDTLIKLTSAVGQTVQAAGMILHEDGVAMRLLKGNQTWAQKPKPKPHQPKSCAYSWCLHLTLAKAKDGKIWCWIPKHTALRY